MKPKKLMLFAALFAMSGGWVEAQKPLAPLPPVEQEGVEARASQVAPPEVVDSAVAAVTALGNEVVLGRFQVAVERMNPQWKERTANRIGGMKKLEEELNGVAREMVRQGISMISFKPTGQPRSFEVGPGKKVEKVNGVDVESLVFNKWLVMVPTVTKFRINRDGVAKPLIVESVGFQVAVSEKGKNDWTFIDGSGITVNDLRSLYVTLPQDLVLPPVQKREAQ